ncbi:hypothetical protein JCM5353_000540 [Sporobolomyces roseus]
MRVIKVLKPINEEKIKNESKVSMHSTPWKLAWRLSTDSILVANEARIIHRDVKPLDIVIDHSQPKLRLLDCVLAEFYHPGQELNVRVASRFYKGPELLVDHGFYDYSLDLWSVGCTFSLTLFAPSHVLHLRRDPLFHDSYDQLVKIAKVLGTEGLPQHLQKHENDLAPIFDEGEHQLSNYPRKALSKFVNAENQRYISNEAIHPVDRLSTYDHERSDGASLFPCAPPSLHLYITQY